MKTITTIFDKVAYSRFMLKYGLLFAAVLFSVHKCTGGTTPTP